MTTTEEYAAFIGAVLEILDRRQEGEWVREGPMVSCPECAFTMHVSHAQDDGSYRCPNCITDALVELTDPLRADDAVAVWAAQIAGWEKSRDEDLAELERLTVERDRAIHLADQLSATLRGEADGAAATSEVMR